MVENIKMILAMRRNQQKRHGKDFVEKLKMSALRPMDVALLPPQETLELENFVLHEVRNHVGPNHRKKYLRWEDILKRIENLLSDKANEKLSVLLCTKPEFSFNCFISDLSYLAKLALDLDGDTIYVVDSRNWEFGFGIDKYEENGQFLFEFDKLEFHERQ